MPLFYVKIRKNIDICNYLPIYYPAICRGWRTFSVPSFLYGGSFGENYCFGLEQLPAKGDTLFITGGEKDVLSLAAHGFHVICFNSETVMIPSTLVYRLTFRFKHIVLLFDMDKTGRESSSRQERLLGEFGVKRLSLPLPVYIATA